MIPPSGQPPRGSSAASCPAATASLAGPSPPGRRLPWRLACLSALLVAAGFLAFSIDLPTARWLDHARRATGGNAERQRLPGDVVRILNLSEVFGYAPTAAIILLAAFLLDPSFRGDGGRRRFLGSIAPMVGATFSGGLATDILKLVVVRVRPYAADLAAHATAWGTFQNMEAASGAAMRSFPSGHAAVAAGLAATLCWRYPRGMPLFVPLGIAAATQRLTSCSHYASDVCFGGAIALAFAAAWVRRANSRMPAEFPRESCGE